LRIVWWRRAGGVDLIFGGCLFRAHDGTADEGLACAVRKCYVSSSLTENNLRIFPQLFRGARATPLWFIPCVVEPIERGIGKR
jgi:hypothetical protein